jgi:hypothetical protein
MYVRCASPAQAFHKQFTGFAAHLQGMQALLLEMHDSQGIAQLVQIDARNADTNVAFGKSCVRFATELLFHLPENISGVRQLQHSCEPCELL